MIEFDDSGYAVNRPIRPEAWRASVPGLPDGLAISRNAFPPGFLLVQNYLDPALCDQLVRECDQLPGIRHGVGAAEDDDSLVYNDIRISETVDIRKLSVNVKSLVRDLFVKTIGPHYEQEIEWFERPEILRYHPGGEYKPHADSENWFSKEKTWKRVLDRDLSILLYLNDGFTGGEIAFPNFGLKFKPVRGLMVAFPSDGRYLHSARPVVTGVRYALVSWAAVRGTPRVQKEMSDVIRI